MPSDNGLPEGWRTRRIGDVAKVRFSSVDKRTQDGEKTVRLCNYMEVWKNSYIRRDMPFMAATATDREISQFRLRQHDVLLTKDSETKHEIAQASVVRDELDNVILGYHLALIRPDPKEAHGPFVSAQLNERQFRRQFVRVAGGATRYGLGLDAVKDGVVWLPEVHEQHQIADALQAVDDAIEQTRGVIAQTRQLKTAVLQDLLTRGLPRRHSEFRDVYRLGNIPTVWAVTPLRRLAEIQQGIALGPHREPKHNPTPYLRVANVQAGWIDLSEIKDIEATDAERHRYAVQVDDVLIVEGHANINDLGRAALVDEHSKDLVFQNHLFRLRADRTCLDPRFLVYWINSHAGRDYFRIFGGTTSGLNTVGAGQIGALKFPTPPLEEQTAIANLVQAIDRRLDTMQGALLQLGKAKTALSQTLLTGQVRVRVKGVAIG